MGQRGETARGAAQAGSQASWAVEQVRYLLSEKMESALRARHDADPMRVEVAQSLSALAGMIVREGEPRDAREACAAAVAHLRRSRAAGGEVARALGHALLNHVIVESESVPPVEQGVVGALSIEALRMLVTSQVGEDESDSGQGDATEVLVAAASMAARAQGDLEEVDAQLIADIVTTADRSVQSPGAASTETLRTFGFDLTSLATRLVGRDRPRAAEQVSSAAAVLYRTLAAREPERYGPDLAIALKNCAVLAEQLGGRSEEVAAHAHDAAEWYGRPSERGGPQAEAQASMLVLEARSWLAAGAYRAAAAPAGAAQAIYESLVAIDPVGHAGRLHTASSLVRLARSGAN